MSSSKINTRIDAHQHFWQYNPAEHAWMTEEMAAIRRDFLPADLKPLLDRLGFDGCVAVQVRQNLEETRWLLELARRHDFVRGVVGWADLRSTELPAQLREFAGEEKLIGVRHIVQDEPDDDFMLRDDFRRGIARLHAPASCGDPAGGGISRSTLRAGPYREAADRGRKADRRRKP